MRKILLLLASCLLFLVSINFIFPNKTYSVDVKDYPVQLRADPVCAGAEQNVPAIAFKWNAPQDYDKFNTRLYYTGLDTPFLDVSGSEADMPFVKNVSPNTLINWAVEVCDKAWSSHQCEKVSGDPVTSGNCSTTHPAPATPKSCPKCPSGYTWSNVDNLCRNGSELKDPVSRVDCSLNGTQCKAGFGTCFTPDSELPHNCSNRSTQCNERDYPECYDFKPNEVWDCGERSGGCPMYVDGVSKSCAYPRSLSCNNEGGTCSGKAGSSGPGSGCCGRLICNKTGNDDLVGTCRQATRDENMCEKCPESTTWNRQKERCENSSGNEVEGLFIQCQSRKCIPGSGCELNSIDDRPKPNTPLSQPCTDADDKWGCLKINTALGDVDTQAPEFVRWVLSFVLGVSGGVVLIIIIITGYRLMTSQGDPEKVKNAREALTAAIVGLLFIIFSLVILQFITVNVLQLPGFGG